MKTLSSAQIREAFLRFFEERSRHRVSSSALVPQDDPTLLFINSGMVQSRDIFTGREKRDYTWTTSAEPVEPSHPSPCYRTRSAG